MPRVFPQLQNINDPEPDKKWLKLFAQTLQRSYQLLAGIINGHIAYGAVPTNINVLGAGGIAPLDNLDGIFLVTPANGQPGQVLANTDFVVNHGMGRIPTGYYIVRQIPNVANTPGVVFDGSIPPNNLQILLRFSAAGQYWVVIF